MFDNKDLSYNLPGYGPLKVTLFPYANCVYDFLAYYGHDTRLQTTNQLGVLRNIFKGAHHTRYEYVFIQWAFVNELQKIKANTDININTNRNEYFKLDDFKKTPTGAEILQILILLSNAGHLPETFTALRSFLHILRNNKETRALFRSGLDKEDRFFYDETVDSFQIFHMQYLVILFLLQRYTRLNKYGKGKDIVNLTSNILRDYVKKKNEAREPLKKIWNLYDIIRRISYLVLDSHYTPVPFSINLSSIILNLEELIQAMVDQNSSFRLALQQLNVVVRDNVYMCGPSLLEISRITEQTLNNFSGFEEKLQSVNDIKQLLVPNNSDLCPFKTLQVVFNTQHILKLSEPDWASKSIVHISYSLEDLQGLSNLDTVMMERNKRKKIGINSCRVGVQLCPERHRLSITYGINKDLTCADKIRTTLSILSDLHYFHVRHYRSDDSIKNDINNAHLINLFLKSIISWEARFKLESPAGRNISPYSYGRGTLKASKWLTKYIKDLQKELNILDEDLEHELKFITEILKYLNIKSSAICFVGSTKVMLSSSTTEVAEFDGLVILPNENPHERFAVIIEAKNQKDGHKTGKKQLQNRLKSLLLSDIDYDIESKYKKGAFATLKLKC